LNLEKIKHGIKTLAGCRGIRGVDDTSSFCPWTYKIIINYQFSALISGPQLALLKGTISLLLVCQSASSFSDIIILKFDT
jgi:hypothetical protein